MHLCCSLVGCLPTAEQGFFGPSWCLLCDPSPGELSTLRTIAHGQPQNRNSAMQAPTIRSPSWLVADVQPCIRTIVCHSASSKLQHSLCRRTSAPAPKFGFSFPDLKATCAKVCAVRRFFWRPGEAMWCLLSLRLFLLVPWFVQFSSSRVLVSKVSGPGAPGFADV